VQGTHGPAIWAWDWVENRGNTPAVGSQSKATANKLRGGWLYAPGANISLFYIRAQQNNSAAVAAVDATSSRLTQNGGAWWEHTGNLRWKNYSKIRDISGCNVG
jgi:DNA-binding transcriptional MocR family regulator